MIIRAKKKANYFCLPNAIADDNRLSGDSVKVLLYILAKPDNWKVLPKQIAEVKAMNDKAVYKAINQLISLGYINSQRIRGKARFERWEYTVT
ncbi:MAG: Rrf2 family transcriptional regulator, partial [Desulfamplus sp.]|nr:Rrf2 family transcriptional regulator [Desulfamplus sp.]